MDAIFAVIEGTATRGELLMIAAMVVVGVVVWIKRKEWLN